MFEYTLIVCYYPYRNKFIQDGTMKNSYVHIYTGNGKGKTTASVGLAVRALGSGKSVKFVQFLKGRKTGEMDMLKQMGAEFIRVSDCKKFFYLMSEEEKHDIKKQTQDFIPRIFEWLGKTDLLVMDEVMGALSLGIIETEQIKSIIGEREGTEVVLTGRDAPQELIELADLVTRMEPVKHYFDKGVKARRGIEF